MLDLGRTKNKKKNVWEKNMQRNIPLFMDWDFDKKLLSSYRKKVFFLVIQKTMKKCK